MKTNGGGTIVNTASVVAAVGIGNRAAYCASKGAVAALTRAIAIDHVGDGIRCNAIAPGTIDTPYFDEILQKSANPDLTRKALAARQLFGRLGTPEEIASGILFLASDESRFATGTILTLDGGMQGQPYRVVKTAKGLDVPYGSEYVLEGRLLSRQREMEGPFGEFPGYYSGGHRYPVIEIDRVSHRKNPIFDAVYVGRPWTELDFLQAMTTSAPIFVQLNHMFPEVIAVNALYTHGLVVIVSTKVRYGGFAKSVGMGVLTTPHGLGYAKFVIVVDADVDPFNLDQVMVLARNDCRERPATATDHQTRNSEAEQHVSETKSGSASDTVGKSGSAGNRPWLAAANAFSLPLLMCWKASPRFANIISTCPPITSVSAGGTPL